MSVILIVLPLGIALGALGVAGFIWATRSGQFDDLDTPGIRAVLDDDESPPA